jgi:hypothetical protein
MTEHVPAAAEGLSATRRTALALTGWGVVAALTTIAATARASSVDPSLAAVEALIQRHAGAVNAGKAAWEAIPSDDDPRRPWVRVQVGRLLTGRDDDGNDIFEPIWAYSDENIEQLINRSRPASLSIGGPERAAAVNERFDARIAAAKAELAALQAEDDRILAQIGYTAATEKASVALDVVRAIEHEILSFVPGTLAAAARQAEWATAGLADDGDYYLDGADMQKLVASISAAGAVS